jgi:hypothetical protein
MVLRRNQRFTSADSVITEAFIAIDLYLLNNLLWVTVVAKEK